MNKKEYGIYRKMNIKYWLMAFSIPVFIMLMIYAILGIYPFGTTSVLIIDLDNQYIAFLAYLKEVLSGKHGLTYTFSKTLGGDMLGLSAYYLLSPLNLLLTFFSVEKLWLAVEIITLIKLGLCGITFFGFISTKEKGVIELIFSTAYALSAYNIMYQQNIMWLDGVILLPVVCIGIRKIIDNKPPFLYIVSLFMAIVTNYYIGFMICIFSVLFFLYSCICTDKKAGMIRIMCEFGIASILSGGLSMWLLIPVLKSLKGGKAVFDLSLLSMNSNFYITDILGKIFIGSGSPKEVQVGLPNIYCTMLALVFAGAFFLNRRIQLKKKIGAIFLLMCIFGSFYFNGINLIWHGFNIPAWFPYRYSFVFCFFVLVLAWEGLKKTKEFDLRELLIIVCLIIAAIVFVAVWMMRKPFSFMTTEKYILSLIVVVLVVILQIWNWVLKNYKMNDILTENGKGFRHELPVILLLLVCGFELCANGVYSLSDFGYKEISSYEDFVKEVNPSVEYVKENDKGFYRMEKTFNRKECDPMTFDYNGLSHYSSTEKTEVKELMGTLGFRNNGNWSYYNRGSSYAVDGLLGVKYILSKKELTSYYTKLTEIGNINIYQNPYALSIGMLAEEGISSLDWNQNHKFELQNEIYHSLRRDVKEDLFKEEIVKDRIIKNLYQNKEQPGYYFKENDEEEAFIEYQFIASSTNPIFAYLGTLEMKKVEIYVNDRSLGKYFDTYQYDIIRLGDFEEGQNVKVRVVLKDHYVNITDVWFYYQDMSVYQKYYESLSQDDIEFLKVSDTYIKGNIDNDLGHPYAFFTIPQEEGWHAYVDGKEVEIQKSGIFMIVPIEEGNHEIELSYKVVGRNTGILITLLSIILIMAWMCLRYNSLKKYKK